MSVDAMRHISEIPEDTYRHKDFAVQRLVSWTGFELEPIVNLNVQNSAHLKCCCICEQSCINLNL